MTIVRPGLEVLLDDPRPIAGKNIGLVTNQSGVTGDLRHVVELLHRNTDWKLTTLFGPEHGIWGEAQDMAHVGHSVDPMTGLTVYSLYGASESDLAPRQELLRGLDALVIDLQDIGARIYTYIYTMSNCMRAAAKHGVAVIVCDRPNPIGGVDVEGATLRRGWESFVGLFPIPMRHGMTMGELAKLFNDAFGLGASLDVVKMEGWTRDMYADATGLPWVMPSPNMPTLDTAVVYPGTVLFEGTMVSEGRGTTRPFELVGAPWIDAEQFAAAMNGAGLDGAYFRPAGFEPTFQKHAKQACGGCQIHVTDRAVFKPVITGIALIDMFRRSDPSRFAWRQPPYEYEHDKMPIDILAGSDALRQQVESGVPIAEIAARWKDDEKGFERLRQPFLMY